MDPAGLLISIATIACTLDELSTTYNSASNTLALIKSQIKILETGAQRIQEWLHFTDPTSQMQVMHSLRDAIATVNSSLQRLQDDVTDTTRTGPKHVKLLGRTCSDQWLETEFAYDEARMRTHLTDTRECASLMQFTLNVCQLPIGQTAEKEVCELQLGAKALHRAQTSTRQQRRSLIQQSSSDEAQEHSEDYKTFMKQVLDAEADLPDEPPTPTQPGSPVSAMSEQSLVPRPLHVSPIEPDRELMASPPTQAATDRDELHLPPSEVGVAISTPYAEAQPLAPTPSSPAHTSRCTLSSDHLASSVSDLTSTAPLVSDGRASPPPPIPLKSLDRHSVYAGASSTQARPQVKRKPVSRASVPGSTSSLTKGNPSIEKLPYVASDRALTASPADSAYAMMEKMTPLTQSLSSLATSDYLSIELDQPPIQPYADNPPVYTPPAQSPPEVARMPRRNTARSAVLEEAYPVIVRQARENRSEELLAHLQEGANVNEADPRTGRTAVMEAARFRRWDICRLLLQANARLHLKDTEGNTVLHLAAQEGDADICQMFVESGAQLQDCNRDGQTPLELAAGRGHTEAVLCLVNGMTTRKANDPMLVKAFFEAVKLGDVPTVGAFLAKDVRPKKIKESWKATAFAAQSGSLPMLELMLAQKCSLKERSPAGWTPLHFAARYGHQPMVEKLLALKVPWKAQTKKAEETALHVAAATGHAATALALMASKDANVTMKDADNQEPIHHAVRHGDVKLTAALIDQGAKLSTANKYGWKPIHLAAAYGHVALLAECMTRGISIEERTSTPAFKPEKRTNAAARRGYWAEIRWPHAGARPLHLALEFGRDDIATVLMSGGAKIDDGDSRGWRPLHYAAFNCRPEMVELLLQKGATPEAKTVDAHTPLTLGFREYGLTADTTQRVRVVEMLEIAVARQRRSKLKSFTSSFMSPTPSQSKTAAQRNLAWHTAQLAEALYHSDNTRADNTQEEDDDDEFSVDDSETHLSSETLTTEELEDAYASQAGPSQSMKA